MDGRTENRTGIAKPTDGAILHKNFCVEVFEQIVRSLTAYHISFKPGFIASPDRLYIFKKELDVSSTPRMLPHTTKVLMPYVLSFPSFQDNCKKSLDQQFQANKS
jgi:hypothetical protein